MISNDERVEVLKTFIDQHQGKAEFKEELKTAKRFLEQIADVTS
jgi:hypothetical protein